MSNNIEAHIPEMTNSLGRYWKQPNVDEILIDGSHAIMSRQSFDELADYSRSIPSGVYAGKMWKSIMPDGRQFLRWYGIVSGRGDVCSCNSREILIVEVSND